MTQGIAIITRSTGIVGRAAALKLADDGFDIALSDDSSQKGALSQLRPEIESKGVRCKSFLCDLLEEESIKNLINDVTRELGGVDVMFVNALDLLSLSTGFKPLTETSTDDWDRSFAANTRPVFLCYKYAAAQMIKQGRGGRLIVRASTSVLQGYLQNTSALAGALFAVRGLSQTAALELGPHNITVNVVSHGFSDDSAEEPYGYGQAINQYDQAAHQFNPKSKNVQGVREIVAARVPLAQKYVTGQDIARIVALLAGRESNFMTGQTIAVNGGIVMH